MLQGFGKDIKGLEKACYESVEEAKKAAAEANNETVSHEKRMLFYLKPDFFYFFSSKLSLKDNRPKTDFFDQIHFL